MGKKRGKNGKTTSAFRASENIKSLILEHGKNSNYMVVKQTYNICYSRVHGHCHLNFYYNLCHIDKTGYSMARKTANITPHL